METGSGNVCGRGGGRVVGNSGGGLAWRLNSIPGKAFYHRLGKNLSVKGTACPVLVDVRRFKVNPVSLLVGEGLASRYIREAAKW